MNPSKKAGNGRNTPRRQQTEESRKKAAMILMAVGVWLKRPVGPAEMGSNWFGLAKRARGRSAG